MTTEHATLRLLKMGAGSSQVSAGERKASELVFFIRYLTEARNPSQEARELARLVGELEQGSGPPLVVLPDDWNFEYTATESPDDPARYLLLGLRPPSFIHSGAPQKRKLLLPAVPADARYLELSVEVRVEGALEGEHERSDQLDVPLHLIPADLSDRLRLAVGLQFESVRLIGRPYRLTAAGTATTGIIPESGEIVLPRKVTSGSGLLEVQPFENANTWYSWELDLGSLEAVEDATGVQARLNSQGFGAGPVDGDLGPRTQAALRAFQQHHGVLADGSASAETKLKLVERHGC
jgi:Putative peptidoglycan binding domain